MGIFILNDNDCPERQMRETIRVARNIFGVRATFAN